MELGIQLYVALKDIFSLLQDFYSLNNAVLAKLYIYIF